MFGIILSAAFKYSKSAPWLFARRLIAPGKVSSLIGFASNYYFHLPDLLKPDS